jgi:endoglycosylceramidase
MKLVLAGLLALSMAPAATLDELHIDGTLLRDSANRAMILRGVVTITLNNNGKPMIMTDSDFQRIRSWGYNIQQIRLEGCRMGVLPPCKPDPDYLAKLDSWVTAGASVGLYTIFKCTIYDVPGFQWSKYWKPGAWNPIWDVKDGWQEQYIAGWESIWRHFANNPVVIGYDFLNEPVAGTDTPNFTRDHLFPFYKKALAALRRIDPNKYFVPQPGVIQNEPLPPLGDEHILFAPHFYPPPNVDQTEMMERLVRAGQTMNVPMLIGEYGWPDVPYHGKLVTPERDQLDARLFDRFSLGTIKTWYTSVGDWALLTPDGNENPRVAIFSRPFPQRVAGISKGFSFDFKTREWNFEWEQDASAKAPTVIFVAQKRHYPDGFRVVTGDGLELASNHAASGDLRYDAASEILTVAPGKGGKRTIRIIAMK